MWNHKSNKVSLVNGDLFFKQGALVSSHKPFWIHSIKLFHVFVANSDLLHSLLHAGIWIPFDEAKHGPHQQQTFLGIKLWSRSRCEREPQQPQSDTRILPARAGFVALPGSNDHRALTIKPRSFFTPTTQIENHCLWRGFSSHQVLQNLSGL